MRRLMLKDAAVLRTRGFATIALIAAALALIGGAGPGQAGFIVLDLNIVILSLASGDGWSMKLLRSLPVRARAAVGSRYVLVPLLVPAFLAITALSRGAAALFFPGRGILAPETVPLTFSAALLAFGLLLPIYYLFDFMVFMMTSSLIIALAAGVAVYGVMEKAIGQGLPLMMPPYIGWLLRPEGAWLLFCGAALFFGATFFLSCRAFESRDAAAEIPLFMVIGSYGAAR